MKNPTSPLRQLLIVVPVLALASGPLLAAVAESDNDPEGR